MNATDYLVIEHAGVKVDLVAQRAWRDGREVGVTPCGLQILTQIVAAAGRPVTTDELLARLDNAISRNQVYVVVRSLRMALERKSRPVLLSSPNVGYWLEDRHAS